MKLSVSEKPSVTRGIDLVICNYIKVITARKFHQVEAAITFCNTPHLQP